MSDELRAPSRPPQRKRNGAIESAAGHHRVAAAIKAGVDKADVFVGKDTDDARMILIRTEIGSDPGAVRGPVNTTVGGDGGGGPGALRHGRYIHELLKVGKTALYAALAVATSKARGLRWGRPKPSVGLAWYRREDWETLRDLFPDRSALHAT